MGQNMAGGITLSTDLHNDTTLFTVRDLCTVEDVIRAIETFCASGKVTQYILWDFREGDIDPISMEGIKKIVAVIKKVAHLRKNGRTAMVFSDDRAFSMGRIFANDSDLGSVDISYGAFRNFDKAVDWLHEDDILLKQVLK